MNSAFKFQSEIEVEFNEGKNNLYWKLIWSILEKANQHRTVKNGLQDWVQFDSEIDY